VIRVDRGKASAARLVGNTATGTNSLVSVSIRLLAQGFAAALLLSLVSACVARPGVTPARVVTAADASRGEPDVRQNRLDRSFQHARMLIEARTETDLSAIGLRLVDDVDMSDEVDYETRRLVEGRLGKTRLSAQISGSLHDDHKGTYAALYSGRSQTVLVSRDMLERYLASLPSDRQRRDNALLVLMLHELVHAADDVRHGIHANRTLDFRASFAQSAVYEGHAQWQTREICREHECLDGLDALSNFMFGRPANTSAGGRRGDTTTRTVAVKDRAMPLSERNLLEYSYIEGERFVAGLAARRNGARLIEQLLASPPDDPLQILDPGSYPNDARELRNRELLDKARSVAHVWLEPGIDRRIAVETSPLKGVNLQGAPERRKAAIDGFTRLVTAMVAIQFHDPEATTLSPVEVTLLQTDTPRIATLFAETLKAHAAIPGSRNRDVDDPPSSADTWPATSLYRGESPGLDGRRWFTSIASAGTFVVQASGHETDPENVDRYVLGALEGLLAAPRQTRQ